MSVDSSVSQRVKAWGVVIAASLFFFYEFIQQNMFDAISSNLMKAFSINGEQLGKFSAYYFVGNVLFLFVAGSLLDRFSARKVILWALTICIAGIVGLSMAGSFLVASLGRLLMGIGGAFCFISVLRLASRWFPAKKMALVSGVSVTMAMLGGFVAQKPMTALVGYLGWRQALQVDAALGLLFFIVIAIFVTDYPDKAKKITAQEQIKIRELGLGKSLQMAYLKAQNWLGGIYCCLMNLPIMLLGGLWGIMYLMQAHGFSKSDASYITSALFFGCVFGAPSAGWLSDRLGRRKPLMIFGAIVSLALILLVIVQQQMAFWPLMILFFAIGFTTSTQVISYALVSESSQRVITAMSVSVVNISVMSGGWLFQPFFGYLLDKRAYLRTHHMAHHFIGIDFSWAMWIFPAGFVAALLAAICVRETFCRNRHHQQNGIAVESAYGKPVNA